MIELHISSEPVPRGERIGHKRLIDIRKNEKRRIGAEIDAQYQGELLNGAVRVDYMFYLRIPQRATKAQKMRMLSGQDRPTKRPDCSNLVKLIEDVMTGRIYVDDSLIVSGEFNKYWAETGSTVLRIQTLSEYLSSI